MARRGSIISAIYDSYKQALDSSQERYEDLYAERAINAIDFYDRFLRDLIVSYAAFEDPALRRRIRKDVSDFFNRDSVQFVAIDGTCRKNPFNDFMVFTSIAYGVRGEISLVGDPPNLQYKRRTMDEDVSMVAYVPVPFAEIADVANPDRLENFVVTDQDKVDLSSIHNSLMQLAEVYLAYEMARSTAPDRPRLILMDHSPSSIMASTDVGVKRIGIVTAPDLDTRNIGLLGYNVGRRMLDQGDAVVAYAHPFNEELGLPSTKRFRLYNAIIAESVRQRIRVGQELDIGTFAGRRNLTLDEIEAHFRRNSKVIESLGVYDAATKTFMPNFDYERSWWDSVRLFEDICRRLFREKNQDALIYDAPDEDDPTRIRRRWMSPDDISFLIAIGIRALVEECWRNQVMLIGIVKDSASRYFTRNYYGLMRYREVYPKIDVKPLPWTDRIVLEDIAFQIDELTAPWSTIEFDSCFMTLHLGLREDRNQPQPMGVKGDVVNQERLFARSLAQFFLKRKPGKSTPLMGHVVFVDRLLLPYWDDTLCQGVAIETPELGCIEPFLHKDIRVENSGQQVAMYFLDTLTRNLFPEAIGYPDPLHKADWGAKTVGRRVAQVIDDSVIVFRARPLTKTLRAVRDEYKRK